MPSQTRIAGAGGVDASVGTIGWSNAANVTADDDTRAESASALTNPSTTNYLYGDNFGFTIPADATIDGIVLEVNRSQSALSSVRDGSVRLHKSAYVGDDKAAAGAWPRTADGETTASYGGATDLWGTTWTRDEVNSASFRAAISATRSSGSGSSFARVDFLRLTVHYTEAPPPSTGPEAVTLDEATFVLDRSSVGFAADEAAVAFTLDAGRGAEFELRC